LAVFGLDHQVDHFDNQVYPSGPTKLEAEELGRILSIHACLGELSCTGIDP
jgi:hypothetical protein